MGPTKELNFFSILVRLRYAWFNWYKIWVQNGRNGIFDNIIGKNRDPHRFIFDFEQNIRILGCRLLSQRESPLELRYIKGQQKLLNYVSDHVKGVALEDNALAGR